MAVKGWIHKFAFQDDALSADTTGRAAMQDGFVNGAKIEDHAVTVDKLDPTLIKYLVEVARVDSAHVDYCRVG